MSDHIYYSAENKHNEREITIVNVALLVGKAPTKEKRIRIKVRDILSGQAVAGEPDWISAAHTFVAQWHDPVSPAVEFSGYDLEFSIDNLFDAQGVKAPKCQMRSFEIAECGDSESPDVAMTFTVYAPFSTALWNWLGQYGGDSCWCSFAQGVVGMADGTMVVVPPDELAGDDDDDDEEKREEGSGDPRPGVIAMVPGKHSAKELAEYHLDKMAEESKPKKGRGRPRRDSVDPLTVQTPAMAESDFF